ncbi:MAG: exodeoxyribonuclease VII small subunit [Candidatus Wildermuthbacteria bacterium RIFCSPHIGHO2_01_FULL_45_20]|uniref:Exodeoxyribonuclease 7 small subunit n=1 Tax=Candidatus Wildermuthbacteria bacterium RIFCSPHIGHO2_02_FULL_45_25 TaxID=1802450 RepID=A0A1G2R4K4_9BACT|nr:MAG: exodeoxyribonuclease VII small subunit [Candidatus Wildermuthbacteria bacterium RIFCSPHIGHO2_01_FULL_45_20]OHA67657.1 MAG: exodeoxyribonuclease VII small subunit [Candidatus Wildermuthbacteria bacterium RIFCSPHIGHO2_02_FULL_45_25]
MPKEKQTLQEALEKLEIIVNDLGKKDVDVEAGLEHFREGVSLIKFCRQQLKSAENEFIKLKEELEVEKEN